MTEAKKIAKLLVSKGFVDGAVIEDALKLVSGEGISLDDACKRLSLIDDAQYLEALAELYGLEIASLDDSRIDDEFMSVIPHELLRRNMIVQVLQGKDVLLVTSKPSDLFTLDMIEKLLEQGGVQPGRLAVASERDIENFLNRNAADTGLLKDAADVFNVLELGEVTDLPSADETLSIDSIADGASPVVKLVDSILYDAVSKRASDIHLETTSKGLVAKYRIDGVLYQVMDTIDKRYQASIISRIKVMSELDISERRTPQDGRFKVRFKDKAIDFRVSIMPCIHGEDAVIRILDKEYISAEFKELRLESLGFSGRDVVQLRRMIKEPYGMVLVTGPTGSGKTTTLYAALSEIHTGRDKIITIEDPVEYELAGVVQIQVNEKKNLTFAKGLRSILRHDPDKIMVGEIRDAETGQIAIQAALTGHLVFTTVHANNVFDVIGRFVHMDIDPYNFVSSLNCVIAQRLIRLICNKCREAVTIEPKKLLESGLHFSEYKDVKFYRGAGCEHCHGTGYRGRKAVVEILDLTDEMRDMIASRQPISVLRKKAVESGMVSIRQSALEALRLGETTLDEINRVTFVE
ncbi:Predicted secretion system W protein GspE-like [hydrothermal vent metagenome]|uniref:Predicted secretion system W protein GspE-like n=1 Tax=hydrothermal vent metagenome TaxID=652676 RepID=A0A3B0QNX4_9ZZZZ